MRVALLLPGQIREAAEVYPYIKGRILDRYKPDVFISTWSPSNEIKNSLHEQSKNLKDSLQIEDVVRIFKPKIFSVDEYESEGINRIAEKALSYSHLGPQTGETNPVSIFLMWMKIKQTFVLMREYENRLGEKYDYVIKGRFDVKIHNDLEFDRNLNTISIPVGYDWKGGIGDLYAWGGRESMDWYCSLYDWMEEYILAGELFHSESLLRYHLDRSTYNIDRTDLMISLRGSRVWEKEPSGKNFDKKSYRYIESKGNIWNT